MFHLFIRTLLGCYCNSDSRCFIEGPPLGPSPKLPETHQIIKPFILNYFFLFTRMRVSIWSATKLNVILLSHSHESWPILNISSLLTICLNILIALSLSMSKLKVNTQRKRKTSTDTQTQTRINFETRKLRLTIELATTSCLHLVNC